MNIKRIIAIFCAAAALSALLAVCAFAEGWWDNASADVAVYPGAPQSAAGDVDGSGAVEPADARQALRFAVGLDADQLPYYLSQADYDGDGAVTPEDARRILRCSVQLEGKRIPEADDGAYRLRVSSMFEQYGKLSALIPLEVNTDRVTDEKEGELPLWRLRSAADVEKFCAAYRAVGIKSFDTADVSVFLRRYEETFFANRELFVCYVTEGSGSNLQAVYSPTVTRDDRATAGYPLPDMSAYPTLARGGTLTFSVGSVSPEGYTCDIANWFLFLPVEKIAAQGCAAFACCRGPSGILPHEEYLAARRGATRWDFASERILPGSAEIGLRQEGETSFALVNAQDGGYLWEYDTDASVGHYDDLFTAAPTECDIWIREDLTGKPHAAPGAAGLHLYTVRTDKPGTYTLRFRLKRPWETEPIEERTVTLTVSDARPYTVARAPAPPSDRVAVVDYLTPFAPDAFFAETAYHTCTFRGVIEEVRCYQTSWQDDAGERRGPFDRAILRVRVTDSLQGADGRETVSLLYPCVPCRTENCPVTVEAGNEYWFLNCRLLDETYFEQAGQEDPDSVRDPALRMADAVVGHAARCLLPIKGDTCTVFRGFFTEAQLNGNGITPIPEVPYVTVGAEWMRERLSDMLGQG